jgi:predicted amino acid dehydrogenase
MNKFAFIVNPIDIHNIHQYFPLSRLAPTIFIEKILYSLPPFKLHHIKDIRSLTGEKIEGYFIACPLLTKQMLELEEEFVIKRIMSSVCLAKELGVDIVGLGALTGIIGDGGVRVAEKMQIPITNGASLAAAAILETIEKAAALKKVKLSEAKVVIVGGTNAIGQNCAYALLNRVSSITLIGKKRERLTDLKNFLLQQGTFTKIDWTVTKVEAAIMSADIIIFTTSAIEIPFKATLNCLKKGVIISDIPAPRNIPNEIPQKRNDILVIDGAAIIPPYRVKFPIKSPLGNDSIYACMAETMTLTFEKRFQENFSIGFKPNLGKVKEISDLAKKHGFEVSFTSFGKPIQDEYATIR